MTDGDDEIYTINADGSALARLTMNDATDIGPAWSPDGSRIAFASDRNDVVPLHFSVYVMAGDGTGVTRTTNVPLLSASGPTWSPDGSRLAFALYSPFVEKSRIATVGADDFSFASLIERPERLYQPSWSPGGGQIAYAMGWPYDRLIGVYSMQEDGTGHTYMSSYLTQLWSPVFSPDGSMVAFIYDAGHSVRVRQHLGVMTAGGDFVQDLGWIGDLGDGPGRRGSRVHLLALRHEGRGKLPGTAHVLGELRVFGRLRSRYHRHGRSKPRLGALSTAGARLTAGRSKRLPVRRP
jgi:Tol biopolymer transport system component